MPANKKAKAKKSNRVRSNQTQSSTAQVTASLSNRSVNENNLPELLPADFDELINKYAVTPESYRKVISPLASLVSNIFNFAFEGKWSLRRNTKGDKCWPVFEKTCFKNIPMKIYIRKGQELIFDQIAAAKIDSFAVNRDLEVEKGTFFLDKLI